MKSKLKETKLLMNSVQVMSLVEYGSPVLLKLHQLPSMEGDFSMTAKIAYKAISALSNLICKFMEF